MTEIYEALKGFSDVPLAAAALIFGILLTKKNKTAHGIMFFIIFAAAIMGTVVHCIKMPQTAYKILWVVLYILLFEAVRRFAFLMIQYITHIKFERKSVFALEAVLYVITVMGIFIIFPFNEILVFVLFSVIMLIRLITAVVKNPPVPSIFIILTIFLILSATLQACESFIPFAIVMEHTTILVAMFITYLISKKINKFTKIINACTSTSVFICAIIFS